ncbi:MAG: molybdopterin-guanine dinucleotide biosynthesis protein B [Heliobacteriaceae bacterium]|nr:molybdopterin-guanine dinucleotide biosynthesis protein B [Heliobacteriaceae bacterium]MDD4588633.1 molybdopterin-guanine dinucleotide biosynthesis protein B [Heliobacteriaceae bacterium]
MRSIPVLSIVGTSNSGKTTLIEKMLKELKTRGYQVATIKHDIHGIDVDKPGKDTWRHAKAGADVVVIASPVKLVFIEKLADEPDLDAIIARIKNVDLVLTEGYKNGNKPKIEVCRVAIRSELITPPEQLVAIASDICFNVGVPCFDINDATGLVDLVEEKFLKPQAT